ncbi:putative methyltransferase PMT26 [Bienertia sinuspersici]
MDEFKDEANDQSLQQTSVSVDESKDASKRTTERVSKDQLGLLNETFNQIEATLTQAAESVKQSFLEVTYQKKRHYLDEAPTCAVPLPEGYKSSVRWPTSRGKIWFANVPHIMLIAFKGHQNWIRFSGSYITFPGGGTQFKNSAMHYIDFIQKVILYYIIFSPGHSF